MTLEHASRVTPISQTLIILSSTQKRSNLLETHPKFDTAPQAHSCSTLPYLLVCIKAKEFVYAKSLDLHIPFCSVCNERERKREQTKSKLYLKCHNLFILFLLIYFNRTFFIWKYFQKSYHTHLLLISESYAHISIHTRSVTIIIFLWIILNFAGCIVRAIDSFYSSYK